jgi:hypothetical protein
VMVVEEPAVEVLFAKSRLNCCQIHEGYLSRHRRRSGFVSKLRRVLMSGKVLI